MFRMIKIIVGLLLGLLGTAVVLIWLVLSTAMFSDFRRSTIETALSKQIGQTLLVRDDVRVSLGQIARVYVSGVEIPSENISGTNLAELNLLELDVNLVSLLQGNVEFDKGDAYETNDGLTPKDAEIYHTEQIETFKAAGADIVTALTLNATDEAIGIALAAEAVGIPSVIAFTLEKDRKLRSGETLQQAIETVDDATASAPVYYMINCSHPVDFGPALAREPWVERIRGLRANASTLDHGTLCQLGHLEEGDPDELAEQYCSLKATYPKMNVFGGCCGTDYAHVEKIGKALLAAA